MTGDVQKERELIAKVQKNNDMFAMKELLRLYRGAIRTCVRGAKLNVVMSEEDAITYAENIVRHLIKENFDLSQQNKPSTFIIGSLKNKLMTLRYENMNQVARMSADLTMKAGYVSRAIPMLQRQGIENPTEDQIVNFVKTELGRSQKFTKAEAKRIRDLARVELSGNAAISKDVDGASQMTMGDMFDKQRVSPQDLLNRQFLHDKIERKMIELNFTAKEKRFVRMMYQIGRYKNSPPANLHQAALNCGVPDSTARRLITKVESELKKV